MEYIWNKQLSLSNKSMEREKNLKIVVRKQNGYQNPELLIISDIKRETLLE